MVIFATGRTHGRISADKGSGTGGFAVFKAIYDAEKDPKLALDLGNWTSPAPEGWFSRGRASADCISAVPYAAAAVGMGDLSLTPKDLQDLAEASGPPILASNLYLRNNKKPDFLRSWHIVQAGGRKVGLFSLSINSPDNFNRQKHYPSYKLEKATYEAARAIKALRDNGAELIVLLLGVNREENASQDFFREFLSKLPRIDAVITDEPSLKKPFKVKRAWVAPAGLEMAHAARLALSIDSATGRLAGVKWKLLELDPREHGEDAGMLKVIEGHTKALSAHFGKKIGFLGAALPLEDSGVHPAADFAADCMRRWARTSGAIIGNSEPAAGFSSGPVTTGDLHRAFPLDSNVVFVKIRGEDLERALAALRPGEISVAGLRLFLSNGALERVETEEGQLIPGRVYQLAVPDSLASGRDNPVLYSAAEFVNSKRRLRDVMQWCFSLRKSFTKPAGGRIIDSEEK